MGAVKTALDTRRGVPRSMRGVPVPAAIAKLPKDHRGYFIPWFVADVDGKRDFRVMDPRKLIAAADSNYPRCWICGRAIKHDQHQAFVVGPMCIVNRTSAEPASHVDCAHYAARTCPFLAEPKTVRRSTDDLDVKESAGVMLERNPGVAAVWVTWGGQIFDDGRGRPLFNIGDPRAVAWYATGRKATRFEVLESIRTGLPALVEMANDLDEDNRAEAIAGLQNILELALRYVPGSGYDLERGKFKRGTGPHTLTETAQELMV